MKSIDQVFAGSSTPALFADGYLRYLSSILDSLDRGAIGLFADTLLYARETGATIFFLGNGGSASTASHFASDIAIGTKSWERPFRAVSLCDNAAILTAIANDFGFEHTFTFQLRNQMKPGDVVVAISVSGNSANIVEAVKYANANDAITMGVTGFDGGLLRKLVKVNVHVPTHRGEYGPAEDVHLVLNHLVATYLIKKVETENQSVDLAKTQTL